MICWSRVWTNHWLRRLKYILIKYNHNYFHGFRLSIFLVEILDAKSHRNSYLWSVKFFRSGILARIWTRIEQWLVTFLLMQNICHRIAAWYWRFFAEINILIKGNIYKSNWIELNNLIHTFCTSSFHWSTAVAVVAAAEFDVELFRLRLLECWDQLIGFLVCHSWLVLLRIERVAERCSESDKIAVSADFPLVYGHCWSWESWSVWYDWH